MERLGGGLRRPVGDPRPETRDPSLPTGTRSRTLSQHSSLDHGLPSRCGSWTMATWRVLSLVELGKHIRTAALASTLAV